MALNFSVSSELRSLGGIWTGVEILKQPERINFIISLVADGAFLSDRLLTLNCPLKDSLESGVKSRVSGELWSAAASWSADLIATYSTPDGSQKQDGKQSRM